MNVKDKINKEIAQEFSYRMLEMVHAPSETIVTESHVPPLQMVGHLGSWLYRCMDANH